MLKKLEWDSAFFNLNVGELTLDSFSTPIDLSGFDLLYVLSKEAITCNIPSFIKFFSEEKVKYSKELQQLEAPSSAICSIFDCSYTIEDLYKLAYESGKQSRFLLDTKFTEAKFKELYRLWIDNSLNKQFADDILVYRENNLILGMVTYKASEENATVGLIAVSPNVQGKGIGRKLLCTLESVLVEKKCKKLIIPTQTSNIQACNFYTKQGYKIIEQTTITHYWKN
jgi:ribosomal protein S18 acetylase RimI-like enzyme